MHSEVSGHSNSRAQVLNNILNSHSTTLVKVGWCVSSDNEQISSVKSPQTKCKIAKNKCKIVTKMGEQTEEQIAKRDPKEAEAAGEEQPKVRTFNVSKYRILSIKSLILLKNIWK